MACEQGLNCSSDISWEIYCRVLVLNVALMHKGANLNNIYTVPKQICRKYQMKHETNNQVYSNHVFLEAVGQSLFGLHQKWGGSTQYSCILVHFCTRPHICFMLMFICQSKLCKEGFDCYRYSVKVQWLLCSNLGVSSFSNNQIINFLKQMNVVACPQLEIS